MKKLMMLVAVVAGLGLISVHAEEVNFDGNAIGNQGFMEAIKNARGMECHVVCESPGKCSEVCNITKQMGGDMAAVPAPTPVNPEVLQAGDLGTGKESLNAKLDWSIKLSMEHAQRSKLMQENLEKLLIHGTTDEKHDFVYGNEKKYTFPSRISQGLPGNNKGFQYDLASLPNKGIPACISWGSKEVCIDRQECKDICVAGAVVCYAVTSVTGVVTTVCGPGAAVCTLTCIIKPECTNVPVCLEMGEVPGYGSGTPL